MRLARPVVEAHGASGSAAAHPAAALYDPSELDEAIVDFDLARKRRIWISTTGSTRSITTRFSRSPPTPTRRAIKSAYFAIVAVFHPDRYFGKKLGSFKAQARADLREADRSS